MPVPTVRWGIPLRGQAAVQWLSGARGMSACVITMSPSSQPRMVVVSTGEISDNARSSLASVHEMRDGDNDGQHHEEEDVGRNGQQPDLTASSSIDAIQRLLLSSGNSRARVGRNAVQHAVVLDIVGCDESPLSHVSPRCTRYYVPITAIQHAENAPPPALWTPTWVTYCRPHAAADTGTVPVVVFGDSNRFVVVELSPQWFEACGTRNDVINEDLSVSIKKAVRCCPSTVLDTAEVIRCADAAVVRGALVVGVVTNRAVSFFAVHRNAEDGYLEAVRKVGSLEGMSGSVCRLATVLVGHDDVPPQHPAGRSDVSLVGLEVLVSEGAMTLRQRLWGTFTTVYDATGLETDEVRCTAITADPSTSRRSQALFLEQPGAGTREGEVVIACRPRAVSATDGEWHVAMQVTEAKKMADNEGSSIPTVVEAAGWNAVTGGQSTSTAAAAAKRTIPVGMLLESAGSGFTQSSAQASGATDSSVVKRVHEVLVVNSEFLLPPATDITAVARVPPMFCVQDSPDALRVISTTGNNGDVILMVKDLQRGLLALHNDPLEGNDNKFTIVAAQASPLRLSHEHDNTIIEREVRDDEELEDCDGVGQRVFLVLKVERGSGTGAVDQSLHYLLCCVDYSPEEESGGTVPSQPAPMASAQIHAAPPPLMSQPVGFNVMDVPKLEQLGLSQQTRAPPTQPPLPPAPPTTSPVLTIDGMVEAAVSRAVGERFDRLETLVQRSFSVLTDRITALERKVDKLSGSSA